MPRAVACRHCGASLTGAAEAAGHTGPRIVHDATIGHREPPLPPRPEATADTGPQRRAGESTDDGSQWSDADFERISQTAGLPREDPRERSRSRTGRSGFGRFRPSGGAGFARVFATTGRLKRSGKTKWLAAAVVLIAVGIGAGWLTGRWDGESLIGQSYLRATGMLQSLGAADAARDTAPDRPTAPSAIDTGAVAAGAVEPSEARAPKAPATAEANRASTPVSPRPVAVPPTPAPSSSEPSTTASLVPILPSTPAASGEPAVGASVSESVPSGEPWSVRDVQRELARLGYYTGGLDGQVGPLTRRAVEAFQRDAGLPPTGRIEPALVSELAAKATSNRAGSEGASSRLR